MIPLIVFFCLPHWMGCTGISVALEEELQDLDEDGWSPEDPERPDCNDEDPAVFPGAAEVCDGIDNDCDGDTDERIEEHKYCIDIDGDGVPVLTGDIIYGCAAPGGYVECDDLLQTDVDCEPDDPRVFPGNVESCDGVDNDCDGFTDGEDEDVPDQDGDGFRLCDDCNDVDPTIHPSAEEICDGEDTDCDGHLPDNETDSDGDGFTECEGDCDDENAEAHPDHPEWCDGDDNDCDGLIDDDDLGDSDGDGFGDCSDCDAANPNAYPGNEEICDGVDNDCDGLADGDDPDIDDADGDGSNECLDCDDDNAEVFPGSWEDCLNNIDDDCNGMADNFDTDTCVIVPHRDAMVPGSYDVIDLSNAVDSVAAIGLQPIDGPLGIEVNDEEIIVPEAGNTELYNLLVDDVIYTTVEPVFLRRVAAVPYSSGDDIVIATADATLEDLYEIATIHAEAWELDFAPDDIGNPALPLDDAWYQLSYEDIQLKLLELGLIEELDDPLFVGQIDIADVSVALDEATLFQFAPYFDTHIEIDWLGLDYFQFTAGLDTYGAVGLDVTVSANVYDDLFNSGTIPLATLPPVTIPAAVPIVIVPVVELELVVEAELEASATVEVFADLSISSSWGVFYDAGLPHGDRWGAVIEPPVPDYDFSIAPSGSVSAMVKGQAKLSIQFNIYGLAGPEIGIQPYVKATAEIDPCPRAGVYVGLEGTIGVGTAAFIGLDDFTYEIPVAEYAVFEASCESNCSDGQDNDADGDADCDDLDCQPPFSLECVISEDCGNSFDDDLDGDVDCEDEDCAAEPECTGIEDCGNGLDDDGDGWIDCEDGDCASPQNYQVTLLATEDSYACQNALEMAEGDSGVHCVGQDNVLGWCNSFLNFEWDFAWDDVDMDRQYCSVDDAVLQMAVSSYLGNEDVDASLIAITDPWDEGYTGSELEQLATSGNTQWFTADSSFQGWSAWSLGSVVAAGIEGDQVIEGVKIDAQSFGSTPMGNLICFFSNSYQGYEPQVVVNIECECP